MPPLASIEGVPGHFAAGRIIDIKAGTAIPFDQLIDRFKSKDLVFIGEVHDNPEHHLIEVQILQALMAAEDRLAVAMEFFHEPRQPVLDRYMKGDISEAVFLEDVGWSKGWAFSYHFYRPLILLTREKGKRLLGINAPHSIVRKVARGGLSGLESGERRQLAKDIDLDNSGHRLFVNEAYKDHPHHDLKTFDYFYQAQCVWEETMAENIAQYLKNNRGMLVVFAGNGHIIYKFGIPDRVLRRIPVTMATILLYPLTARSTLNKRMADYVWLTSGCSAGHLMRRTKKTTSLDPK